MCTYMVLIELHMSFILDWLVTVLFRAWLARALEAIKMSPLSITSLISSHGEVLSTREIRELVYSIIHFSPKITMMSYSLVVIPVTRIWSVANILGPGCHRFFFFNYFFRKLYRSFFLLFLPPQKCTLLFSVFFTLLLLLDNCPVDFLYLDLFCVWGYDGRLVASRHQGFYLIMNIIFLYGFLCSIFYFNEDLFWVMWDILVQFWLITFFSWCC